MKLVEILARELEEWPSKICVCIAQDKNRDVYGWSDKPAFDDGDWLVTDTANVVERVDEKPFLRATDYKTAIVTRADWEAERAKLKAHKANGDGWVRHRGGKCPVDVEVIVDTRHRDGDIVTGLDGSFYWRHRQINGDIMAYRIHKPAEQPEIKGVTFGPGAQAITASFDKEPGVRVSLNNPLEWRDRILALDTQRAEVESTYQRQISEITQERELLVRRLAGEGLALVEDMSDPANWLPGDKLEVIDIEYDSHGFETGEIVEMLCHDTNRHRNAPHCKGRRNDWWVLVENLKWHSRPAS